MHYQPLDWLYGEPRSQAQLRTTPEDFYVREDLGYEPEGEGEHYYLLIRKRGENTDWVARQLANFCQVSPRDVAYAGKKDRHAVTEQWFSVHLPGNRRSLNFALFGGDSIQVLQQSKHRRKIKLGHLRGNRFEIRLRKVSNEAELRERFQRLSQGVPNYFGEQRFGHEGGNLEKGQAMLLGEFQERQRHKRGLYISAVRSQLFNETVQERLRQGGFEHLLEGDTLIEPYTQRCERFDPADALQSQRVEQHELVASAPLWGQGEPFSDGLARELELRVASQYPEICEGLVKLGLRQERRAARLIPTELALEQEADGQFLIKFSLPAGCFATSVIRELCTTIPSAGQTQDD